MAKYGVTVWMKAYIETDASSYDEAEAIALQNCFDNIEIDEIENELIEENSEDEDEVKNELADRYWRDYFNLV